jgi:hypothetical protein
LVLLAAHSAAADSCPTALGRCFAACCGQYGKQGVDCGESSVSATLFRYCRGKNPSCIFGSEASSNSFDSCYHSCGASCLPSAAPNLRPQEAPKPADVCDGVRCAGRCVDEGGPTLYFDGVCVHDGSKPEGYDCRYRKAECEWACSGIGCDTTPPLKVRIDSPADGSVYDAGKAGSFLFDVSGTVKSSPAHEVVRVVVSAALDGKDASYDGSTGRFALKGVEARAGRPLRVSAVAYDSQMRRLGWSAVTVYPSTKMLQVHFRCGVGVTVYRNGAPLSCKDLDAVGNVLTAQDGDTVQLSSSGGAWLEYSDGAEVTLKSPARVRFWESSVYVDYGGVEVKVDRGYEVLTRQGHYVAKGTRFSVDVPQDGSGEVLKVSEGAVLAASAASEAQPYEVREGDSAVLKPGAMPAADSQAAGGCCATPALMLVSLAAAAASRL